METTPEETRPDEITDPTVEADRADPTAPGPGDSDGARPEPEPDAAEGDDAANRDADAAEPT